MAPAMEEAHETLRSTVAKLKHVIILTDGVSSPGDFEGIAQAMSADRITVSTVAMGSDADQSLLEDIARIGNGRFYSADDPAQVPQIFAKETVTASKSAINEQPFAPTIVRPTQVLSDIRLDEAPFLLGYVVTRPKPTAEVILATEAGDPLLAWWRYGLGMSVAFTSDAKARWAAEWLSWPQFGQFWAQVVRHSLRKSETKGSVVQIDRTGRKAVVSLDAIEPSGKFLNRAATELTLVDPQLTTRKLEMVQVAPGRYQAEIDTTRGGAYQLMFVQTKDSQVLGRQSRGLAVGYPDELRLRPANAELLAFDRECVGWAIRRQAGIGIRCPRPNFAPRRATLALSGDGRGLVVCARCGIAPDRSVVRFSEAAADVASHAYHLIVQLSSLCLFGFAVQAGFVTQRTNRGANAMSDRILEKLEPVRRRQWTLEIVRYSAMGLLAGSLLAVGLGVWRWQGTGPGAAGQPRSSLGNGDPGGRAGPRSGPRL